MRLVCTCILKNIKALEVLQLNASVLTEGIVVPHFGVNSIRSLKSSLTFSHQTINALRNIMKVPGVYSRLTNQDTSKKVNKTFNDYFSILSINIFVRVSRILNKFKRFKMIT